MDFDDDGDNHAADAVWAVPAELVAGPDLSGPLCLLVVLTLIGDVVLLGVLLAVVLA